MFLMRSRQRQASTGSLTIRIIHQTVIARSHAKLAAKRPQACPRAHGRIFKPSAAGAILYVKLILRANCVVVSFHEDADHDEEEA